MSQSVRNGILLVEIPLHYDICKVEIPLHSATLEESCVLFSCHSTTKVIVVDAVAAAVLKRWTIEQRYE